MNDRGILPANEEDDLTIEMLANIAEVAGGLTLIGGAVFGLVQLRELKQ
ncbi:MAG: hypothetical protein PVJ33_05370 [Lysobacterales bacterium]